jgi:dephospho-CoA kinase
MSPLPLLGLVGGVGSGKSYVAGLFARLGAAVIDADRIGHEALRQPEIQEQLRRTWGESIFNARGEVERRRLGGVVFGNPAERKKLEAIVHPWIGDRIDAALAQAQRDPNVPLAILDAALLLETGWNRVCSAVAFIETPFAVRLERVKSRGWDAAELQRREISQWSLEKKKQLCDLAIENSGNEVLTERLVKEAFSRYARK